jgi:hypothetical protein
MFRWLPFSRWAIVGETTSFSISRKKPSFSIALILGGTADGIARCRNIFMQLNQKLVGAINNRVGMIFAHPSVSKTTPECDISS